MRSIIKKPPRINYLSIQAVLLTLIIVAMAEFISVSIIIFHLMNHLKVNLSDNIIRAFILKIVVINVSMILLFILIVYLISKIYKKINNYAFYSCTTGLPNKNYLWSNLIENFSSNTDFAALINLDMDDFKAVNDTLGHLAGDELLRQAGQRFEKLVKAPDCVCHIGGDEFLFFIKSAKNQQQIEKLAKEIIKIFSKPFPINGHFVDYVTASLGIALMPKDGNDFQTLYNCSDDAMYAAKKFGKGTYKLYDKNMSLHLYEDSIKKKEIKEGIQNKEFKVFYQPKYSKHGQLTGAEALARWVKPDGTIISPAEFIEFAEKNGLIVPLTDLIVQEVCQDLRGWIEQGAIDFVVSINITSEHIVNKKICESLIEQIKSFNIPADFIEFEITESMIIEDFEATVENITMIKNFGIKISMDDFGTGYSSLNYLKSLPLDIIKIDKSFVDTLNEGTQSEKDRVLLKNLINIAHGFKMDVIAEGIETEHQLESLKDMDCDMYQGYYFGKPVEKSSFENLFLGKKQGQ